jgi:hypothetical protein
MVMPTGAFGRFLCANVPNVSCGMGSSTSQTPTGWGPEYFGSLRDTSAFQVARLRGLVMSASWGTSCSVSIVVVVVFWSLTPS